MVMSWEDLGAASLARQLPCEGTVAGPGGVADRLDAVGPIQTQTARSAFLGLAARFSEVTHDALTAAYEQASVVRGSSIRGTVHSATRRHFTVLGSATRVGQRRRWTQLLKMADGVVDDLWAATEEHAREWRTPEELQAHLVSWLREHDSEEAAARAETASGRYLAFGHGALVRRPQSGTRWEGQGRPVYRTLDRALDPSGPTGLPDVIRLHLSRHGPASRYDLAWWSGLPLRVVDDALAAVDVLEQAGPDGRTYLDLPGAPPPLAVAGVRLLPEFDALLCAYEPRARGRFITPDHHRRLWNAANGLVLPPVLVDGRICGHWHLAGKGRSRPLELSWFSGTRRPTRAELEEPVARVEAALGITVSAVDITRELA